MNNDKERLEEIKKSYNFWMEEDESIGILPEDIEWLIGRVQELEKDCDYISHQYALEVEQNKRYREYLELIKTIGIYGKIISTGEIIRSDEANLAFEALEGEEID